MMVRKTIKAASGDDWSELTRSEGLNPWMTAKLWRGREDDQRISIVQQVLQRSTDFLRRIIAPVEGQGGVALSYVIAIVSN